MKLKSLALILPLLATFYFVDSRAQNITTIAGNGHLAYSGDGGQATNACLNFATGLTLDSLGNIFIADNQNNVIRMITPSGIISTVVGTGISGYLGDGGAAIACRLSHPAFVMFDRRGEMLISDEENNVIRKVNKSGVIRTIAGNGTGGYLGDGGPATNAELFSPYGLTCDKNGNIYVADQSYNIIRKIDTFGIISTFAGNGTYGYSGDGGQATAAQLYTPTGLVFDSTGNLFIADGNNNVIRKIAPNGIITTFAGTNAAGYSGDGGASTLAKLNYPILPVFDSAGNLVFSESLNNVIRKVNKTGIITTIAGTGTPGYNGDGLSATATQLNSPVGLAFNKSENLLIADVSNFRIRKIKLHDELGVLPENLDPREFQIFPVPCQSYFTLSGKINNLNSQLLRIEIMDFLGKVQFSQSITCNSETINERIEIDRQLKSGFYLLHISTEGQSKIIPLIIEK